MYMWTLVKKTYLELVRNIEKIQESHYADDIVIRVRIKMYIKNEAVKEIFENPIKKDDKHRYQVFTKFSIRKSVCILAWVSQFMSNCQIRIAQKRK